MAEWKDETSYSRYDVKKEATVFSLKLGVYKLVVMSSHIYYPGQWVMTLRPLINDPMVLTGATTEEQAKIQAINFTRDHLTAITNEALANL